MFPIQDWRKSYTRRGAEELDHHGSRRRGSSLYRSGNSPSLQFQVLIMTARSSFIFAPARGTLSRFEAAQDQAESGERARRWFPAIAQPYRSIRPVAA